MRLLLGLTLALGLAPLGATAQELPVKVRNGDSWIQTSQHTRKDVRNGVETSQTATLVVRATYREEFGVATLRHEFVSANADGASASEVATAAAQAGLVYPAVLEVDESLTPVRVQDWAAMRERVFEGLRRVTDDDQAFEAVRASFEKLDGAQAATMFKQQAFVGLGQGTALELEEPHRYDSHVPNLLGGPPIKASGEFVLVSHDPAQGRAVVTWSQRPDPEAMAVSLKASMEALLARAAPEKLEALRAEFAEMKLERQESCRFEIDVRTGLSEKTVCTVEIRSGTPRETAIRTETWTITQTLPEKR